MPGADVVEDLPRTLDEAAAYVREPGKGSAQLVRALQERADTLADLGVYVARFDDAAEKAAIVADEELAAGQDRGALHGVPIGIKDIAATREGPTTAQSLAIDPTWGRGTDATAVERLRSAGAVVLGKTTTMEFAIGAPDPTRPFPMPRNAWNFEHWAGGSSSGSGSGVAAGLFPAALGSDTGGSIRIPAAYNGITGLKPTFGRVPKDGFFPLAWTLDHVGPLCRSARDCALMLDVIDGHSTADPLSVRAAMPERFHRIDSGLSGVRIGVVTHSGAPGADANLAGLFSDAVAVLADRGASVHEVEIPEFAEGQVASMLLLATEGLARHRASMIDRWDSYGVNARAWFALGAMVTGAEQMQLQRVRLRAARFVAALFDEFDVLVTPTLAGEATSLSDVVQGGFDPVATTEALFVNYWNFVGNPVVAFPIGFGSSGMPLSAQVVGPYFSEHQILQVADLYQQATDWHLLEPAETSRRLRGEARPLAEVAGAGAGAPRLEDGDAAARREVGFLLDLAGLPAAETDMAAQVQAYPSVRAALRRTMDVLAEDDGALPLPLLVGGATG